MSEHIVDPEEIRLKVSIQVAGAELQHFHYQNGGVRLLPQLRKESSNESDWILFRVLDNNSEATITFRPTQSGNAMMTVNRNDTHLWGWMIGVPGRSELGVSTYLAAETSDRCVGFCDKFMRHLDSLGYIVVQSEGTPGYRNSGRPRDFINEWARKETYEKGRKAKEVYPEWLSMMKDDGREFADPWDSFKHAMRLRPQKSP